MWTCITYYDNIVMLIFTNWGLKMIDKLIQFFDKANTASILTGVIAAIVFGILCVTWKYFNKLICFIGNKIKKAVKYCYIKIRKFKWEMGATIKRLYRLYSCKIDYNDYSELERKKNSGVDLSKLELKAHKNVDPNIKKQYEDMRIREKKALIFHEALSKIDMTELLNRPIVHNFKIPNVPDFTPREKF